MTTTFDGFDDYKRVAVASRHTELDATEQDLTDARRDMSRYLRDFQPTKAWTHDVVRLLRRLW